MLPPRQHRRLADRAWLAAARQAISGAGLRADALRNLTAVAEAVAALADFRTLRSRPTLAVLQARTGLSRRTVQTWARWLERAGLLAVLEPGTTPQYRPGILHRGGPNLAREWLLTAPAPMTGPATCTPPTAYGGNPYASAREDRPASRNGTSQDNDDGRFAPGSPSLASPRRPGQAPGWPPGQKPQRRGEKLAASATLARGHMVLRRLSARHLRSILRPWFSAGWTPADVLYALDRTADDRQHEHADRVRHPARWLAARLKHWRSIDGSPLPPHSARLAEAAERHRADQERHRADAAAWSAAASADPGAHADRIREAFGWPHLAAAARTAVPGW